MKLKNVIVLALIFVFLCLTGYFYSCINKPKEIKSFSGLDGKELSKIEITKNEQVYTFENQDGLWQIVKPFNYQADQLLINDLINNVKNITLDAVISTNPEKYKKFQVDKEGGSQLSVYDKANKHVVNVIVGKMAGDYVHAYIKFSDKKEVYLSKGISRYFIDRDIKQWRNKTILALNKDNIDEVNFIYSGADIKNKKEEKVTVKRSNDKWLIDNQEVDATPWDMFLNKITNFNMDDLIDNEDEAKDETKSGLINANFKINIKLKENHEETILIGNKNDKNQYYVRRVGTDTIFLVNTSKIDDLKKKPADLIKKEPADSGNK